MKVCSKCGAEKPDTEFYRRKLRNGEPGALRRECKECTRSQRAAYYEANRDEIRARVKAAYDPAKAKAYNDEYRERNRDRLNARCREWHHKNKERANQRRREWREANPERTAATMKRWQQANPDKVAAHAARRRAVKLRATPPWLTPEQQAQIDAVYAEAARIRDLVGGEVHVDHIVPLNGRNVRGLHVPWNLRPLDGRENRSKGNRLRP